MFTVSAIIPNYNHATFLKQRIDSVLNQSLSVYEVIILDDCSTDKSLDVINEYINHPLVKHVIINEKNSGSPFLQWQKGIDLAKGDWIWIAESDDYADINFLLKMMNLAEQNPSAGLLYANSALVYGEIVQTKTFADLKNEKLKTNRWSTSYFNQGIDEINEALLPHGTINNTSVVLFKTSILKSIHINDKPFKYIGDKYVFIKMLNKTNIAYLPDTLNFYRANPEGKPKYTTDFFQYTIEHFFILSWVKKNIKNLSNVSLQKAIEENCQFSILPIPPKRVSYFYKMLLTDFTLFLILYRYNLKRTLKKIFK
ncbi:MAG: glycosyltransferase family 2 protein [Chryseotalea sp.]|jgi:glycosyltransferase involved in cell wall biosynthesis|nr:glycosyltransferase family 2 protein [Flammeovirgaceae bacterium]